MVAHVCLTSTQPAATSTISLTGRGKIRSATGSLAAKRTKRYRWYMQMQSPLGEYSPASWLRWLGVRLAIWDNRRYGTAGLLAVLFLAGCSSLPAAFFEKDKDFELYGLYQVHPTTGLTGLGWMSYKSKSVDEEKLAEIRKQIDALAAAVAHLAHKEAERQKIKPGISTSSQ